MACEISLLNIRGLYYMLTQDVLMNSNINLKTICNYLKKAMEKNMDKEFLNYIAYYHIQGIYGQGGNGLVMKLCKEDNCIALKVIKTPENRDEFNLIKQEVDMQELFAEYKIAPAILDSNKIGSTTIVLHKNLNPDSEIKYSTKITLLKMDSINFTLHHGIEKGLIRYDNMDTLLYDIIDIFRIKTFEVKCIHGDLHTNNIGIMNDKTVLIDFGWARYESNPIHHFVDFISLIGSLVALSEFQDLKKFCENLANLLMICSNYLYGTQFTSIFNFKRMGQFATYGYFISDSIVISHNKSLNNGGIINLNNQNKKYTFKNLEKHWPSLNTNEEYFDKLLKSISSSGSEFIYNLVQYNSQITL